jgi:hypothetical protein
MAWPLLLCAASATAFAAAGSPTAAVAQDSQRWRTLEASRSLPASSASDTLRVRVAYSVGRLTLGDAASGTLFDLLVRYDANERLVSYSYDPTANVLTVGGDSGFARRFAISHDGKDRGPHPSLALRLAPSLPLDLALRLSAADALLELGGLDVSGLSVDATASGGRLTFDKPNPSRIPSAELRATFAGLSVNGLGNARADTVRAKATLGRIELDLGGDWTGSTTLDLDAVLGVVTVRVPSDVGVKVNASATLGSVDTPGFTARDGALYSDNWSAAKRSVTIVGRAVLARLEVERLP